MISCERSRELSRGRLKGLFKRLVQIFALTVLLFTCGGCQTLNAGREAKSEENPKAEQAAEFSSGLLYTLYLVLPFINR